MYRFRESAAGVAAAFAIAIAPVAPQARPADAVDFGIDKGEFANDGECDDPRFSGEGMSPYLLVEGIRTDASDCRTAFDQGRIGWNPLFVTPKAREDFLFGDDESDFAHDGTCDDIRFVDEYSPQQIYLVEDIGHDATDCRLAMLEGGARWQVDDPQMELGITIDELSAD